MDTAPENDAPEDGMDENDAPADGKRSGDSLLSVLTRLSGRARILLVADFINAFGVGMVLPFLLIYLSQARHINIRIAAATLAVTAVTSFAAGLAWGSAIDRFRHRIVMPTVMVIGACGTFFYAFADKAWIAIAVAVLGGIAAGGNGTVIRTMFATAVPAKELRAFFGLQFGVFNAAIGLGVLVGGLLVNGTLERYQLLYTLDALSYLCIAVILVVVMPGKAGKAAAPREVPPRSEDDGDAEPAPSYRTVVGNPVVLLILAIMSLASIFYYGLFNSVLPGFLTINHAVSPRGISGSFVVNVVVVIVAQFAVIPRLGRIRQTTLLTFSGLLWAVSWLLVLFAGRSSGTSALALLYVASVPFAVGEVMVTPVLAALLNDVIDGRVRGRANALFGFAITGGAIVGPVIAAALLPLGKGVPLVAGLAVGCLLLLIPTVMLRERLGDGGGPAPAEEPAAAPEAAVPAASA